MAKIRNSHPKNSSGGYERVLGNKELADIFTKVQSTVMELILLVFIFVLKKL